MQEGGECYGKTSRTKVSKENQKCSGEDGLQYQIGDLGSLWAEIAVRTKALKWKFLTSQETIIRVREKVERGKVRSWSPQTVERNFYSQRISTHAEWLDLANKKIDTHLNINFR